MELDKGDTVVLHDKHSDFDGETGEITQVSETMFGDKNYTVSFEGGKEHGIPADSLEESDEEISEESEQTDEIDASPE